MFRRRFFKNKIRFSGLKYVFTEEKGVELKISRLSFSLLNIPDVFCVFLKEGKKQYKHRAFEIDILKHEHLKFKNISPNSKGKHSFYSKPFQYDKRIEKVKEDNLVKCKKRDFMKDIIHKRTFGRVFNKFLIASILITVAIFFMMPPLTLLPLLIFVLAYKEVRSFDKRKKTSVIFYEFDNDIYDSYKRLIVGLRRQRKIDTMMMADENSKQKAVIRFNYYSYIKCNVNYALIRMKNLSVGFFPDRLYYFYKDGVLKSCDYSDMVIKHGKSKTKSGEIRYFIALKPKLEELQNEGIILYLDDLKRGAKIGDSLKALT